MKCMIVVSWLSILQVFGGTVICRDLEVATTISRSSEVDCITLDGKLLVCPLFGLTYNMLHLLLGLCSLRSWRFLTFILKSFCPFMNYACGCM